MDGLGSLPFLGVEKETVKRWPFWPPYIKLKTKSKMGQAGPVMQASGHGDKRVDGGGDIMERESWLGVLEIQVGEQCQ